jgi:hypothetical protein
MVLQDGSPDPHFLFFLLLFISYLRKHNLDSFCQLLAHKIGVNLGRPLL